MAKVVCNTSPIIGLSIIDKIELLWEINQEKEEERHNIDELMAEYYLSYDIIKSIIYRKK